MTENKATEVAPLTTREENLNKTTARGASNYLLQNFVFGQDSWLNSVYPEIALRNKESIKEVAPEIYFETAVSLYALNSYFDSLRDLYKSYNWTSKEYKTKKFLQRANDEIYTPFAEEFMADPSKRDRNLVSEKVKETTDKILSLDLDDDYKRKVLAIVTESTFLFLASQELENLKKEFLKVAENSVPTTVAEVH